MLKFHSFKLNEILIQILLHITVFLSVFQREEMGLWLFFHTIISLTEYLILGSHYLLGSLHFVSSINLVLTSSMLVDY